MKELVIGEFQSHYLSLFIVIFCLMFDSIFSSVPDIWVPNIFRATLYSEILDKYLSIIVTEHALRMIDDVYGIDHYILRTPIQDLQSDLALQLRRKMLIALATKSFHPNNPEKARIVYESYKDCEIPVRMNLP